MDWDILLADLEMGQPEIQAVARVIQSRWLSAGAVTREFEQRFAELHDAPDAVAVSSGSAALHLAATALGVGPGDEVILPSLTFVACAAAIAHTGAKPVFAEIQGADDLTISPADVARLIGPNTRAIMVVHYAGYPANMSALGELARTHKLAIIEDAAHAPLTRTPLGVAGAMGDIGCFSFFANKNIVTGEGGIVLAKDATTLAALRSLRSHSMTVTSWDRKEGRAAAYDVSALGFNYRPTEITAALGLAQLERFSADRDNRRRSARLYRKLLSGHERIAIPFGNRDDEGLSHHLFPVILETAELRTALQGELKKHRIQCSVHYPPIHLFSIYRKRFGTGYGDLPLTEDIAQRVLSLPMHGRLQPADVERVSEIVVKLARTTTGSSASAGRPAISGG